MLVNVNVDQQEVREMLRQQIEQAVKEADHESVFWDTKELKRRTCMSWTAIQETFFFEPGFPKRKIGTKWYYPARETREFLEKWLQRLPS
ncbi:group-specific protein [Paenibacillus sp. FSL H7-0326]|uniref:group-specific protein n=1 Tax=Paenibacillus sp. FSL H7-0326 TaxID=1921144 RepID=UPI00096DA07B|nr:group-specific protein [Paenibacillus sp. FSL H7-0326]OMC71509.1 group-specific protein [Paenibacillus sp. FSL H7-0326]